MLYEQVKRYLLSCIIVVFFVVINCFAYAESIKQINTGEKETYVTSNPNNLQIRIESPEIKSVHKALMVSSETNEDGQTTTFSILGDVTANKEGKIILKILCIIENLSNQVQLFRVNELSLLSGKEKINFSLVSVGEGFPTLYTSKN